MNKGNSRGMRLFTCKWLSLSSPKALVFLCHCYGMEYSHSMRECEVRLVSTEYGVLGMDYEGHGEADKVTDPEVSRALYERASSRDKTIKLYPEMWHNLTSGEPDENIDTVFSDIIDWLDKRTSGAVQNRSALQPFHHSHTIPYGIERATTAALPLPDGETPRLPKTRPLPTYFCGLKGRRLLHHSAM